MPLLKKKAEIFAKRTQILNVEEEEEKEEVVGVGYIIMKNECS